MTDDPPSDNALEQLTLRMALAFLDGPWDDAELLRSGRQAAPHAPLADVRRCVGAALATYRKPPWDRPRELAGTLLAALLPDPPRRLRSAVARVPQWPVRALPDLAAVARLAEVAPTELEWYADLRGLERKVRDERLRHYRYRWRPARHRPARLIEAPKDRLKLIQRRILREVLAAVPVSAIAHGYVPGRSAVTAADQHVSAEVLVQLDLAAFFPSVRFGRVAAIFDALGYSAAVARVLAGLTTNAVPLAVLRSRPLPADPDASQLTDRFHADRRLASPHLPQGAPTSPMLANLACHRFDQRLSGIARAFDATVTRYADDITLSGGRRLRARSSQLVALVKQASADEGFTLAAGKTRVATRAQRQQVLGMVVNAERSLPRADLERFEAILTNCVRTGPAQQNRSGHPDFQAHLRGRLAWVAAAAPRKHERLQGLYDRIDWS